MYRELKPLLRKLDSPLYAEAQLLCDQQAAFRAEGKPPLSARVVLRRLLKAGKTVRAARRTDLPVYEVDGEVVLRSVVDRRDGWLFRIPLGLSSRGRTEVVDAMGSYLEDESSHVE